MGRHYLENFFQPKAVAVVGASQKSGSVGSTVYHNLLDQFDKERVYPVNPKHDELGDRRCYRSVQDLPDDVDLAIVVVPAPAVLQVVEACGQKGVKRVIVLSSGFREAGEEGEKREHELKKIADRYEIRFIGPNCLGVVSPRVGLNATFYHGKVKSGHLALISQSGAVCTSIMDWAESRGIGFSSIVSMGEASDIDFDELIDYLAQDTQTKSILIYMEGLRKTRRFMSALRAASRLKPIIAFKVGRHPEGSKAAMSHTGALVGSNEVFSAAFSRAGVIQVSSVTQLFTAAEILSAGVKSHGRRLLVITNGGGPGVMAADAAVENNLSLADLSEESIAELNSFLPTHWSHGNPVDILGDATAEKYRRTIEVGLKDRHVDGLIVILTPQAMTRPMDVAEALTKIKRVGNKPVLACWMGGEQVASSRGLLRQAGIPCFRTPLSAVEAYSFLSTYQTNQQLLLQTPSSVGHWQAPDIAGADLILHQVRDEGRLVLTQVESKAILSAFHIPVAASFYAADAHQALLAAEEIGFPVVMKVHSRTITHKSDIGGVIVGLRSAREVKQAFTELQERVGFAVGAEGFEGVTVEKMSELDGHEFMLGSYRDEVFGPVIQFGLGGTMVEVLKDSALALPPLNEHICESLMKKTKAYRLFSKFRSRAGANKNAIERILLRVSEMVCELPWIKEMDMNPVIADSETAVVVDARIVIDPSRTHIDKYGHLAIHPYPRHLAREWQMSDGSLITIRPIRPEDAEIERNLVNNLSDETKYFRFMSAVHELSQEMLVRFTQIDYDREMALIAVTEKAGQEMELAVGRFIELSDRKTCEFALVVADEWQGKGLGTEIMKDLIQIARGKGLREMMGEIFSINYPMLHLMKKLGFEVEPSDDDAKVVIARMNL